MSRDSTAAWHKTDQLFVCFGAARLGSALSRQRLAHWVTQVIVHAYKSAGQAVLSSVHCHSTRALATSWAAFKIVALSEICDALFPGFTGN